MRKHPLLPDGLPAESHRARGLDEARTVAGTPAPGMTTTATSTADGSAREVAERLDESDAIARMSWEGCPNTD